MGVPSTRPSPGSGQRPNTDPRQMSYCWHWTQPTAGHNYIGHDCVIVGTGHRPQRWRSGCGCMCNIDTAGSFGGRGDDGSTAHVRRCLSRWRPMIYFGWVGKRFATTSHWLHWDAMYVEIMCVENCVLENANVKEMYKADSVRGPLKATE